MNKNRIMTWWQAAIILLSYFFIFTLVAIIDITIIRKELGFSYLIDQISLLLPTIIFVIVLSKICRIDYSHRFNVPKLNAVFLVIGISILLVFILKPFGYPKEYFKSIFLGAPNIQLPSNEMTKIDSFQFIIFGCLLFPIMEEIIYREILLRNLLINYSAIGVIAIISIIFGISHFNPGFFSIILLSVAISYIYLISDSIVLAIIFHCIYNIGVLASSFLHLKMGNFFFSIWYLFLVLICLIITIIFLRKLKEIAFEATSFTKQIPENLIKEI